MVPLCPSIRDFVGFSPTSRKPLFQHQFIYWNADFTYESRSLVYEVDYRASRNPIPPHLASRNPDPVEDAARSKYLLTSGGLLKPEKKQSTEMDDYSYYNHHSAYMSECAKIAAQNSQKFVKYLPTDDVQKQTLLGCGRDIIYWAIFGSLELFRNWSYWLITTYWYLLAIFSAVYIVVIWNRNERPGDEDRLFVERVNDACLAFHDGVVDTKIALSQRLDDLGYALSTWYDEIRFHRYRWIMQAYLRYFFTMRFLTIIFIVLFVWHMFSPPTPRDNDFEARSPTWSNHRRDEGSNSHYIPPSELVSEPDHYSLPQPSTAEQPYVNEPASPIYGPNGITDAWMENVTARTGDFWHDALNDEPTTSETTSQYPTSATEDSEWTTDEEEDTTTQDYEDLPDKSIYFEDQPDSRMDADSATADSSTEYQHQPGQYSEDSTGTTSHNEYQPGLQQSPSIVTPETSNQYYDPASEANATPGQSPDQIPNTVSANSPSKGSSAASTHQPRGNIRQAWRKLMSLYDGTSSHDYAGVPKTSEQYHTPQSVTEDTEFYRTNPTTKFPTPVIPPPTESLSAPHTQDRSVASDGTPSDPTIHCKTKCTSTVTDSTVGENGQTEQRIVEKDGIAYCKQCNQYHCCEFPEEV